MRYLTLTRSHAGSGSPGEFRNGRRARPILKGMAAPPIPTPRLPVIMTLVILGNAYAYDIWLGITLTAIAASIPALLRLFRGVKLLRRGRQQADTPAAPSKAAAPSMEPPRAWEALRDQILDSHPTATTTFSWACVEQHENPCVFAGVNAYRRSGRWDFDVYLCQREYMMFTEATGAAFAHEVAHLTGWRWPVKRYLPWVGSALAFALGCLLPTAAILPLILAEILLVTAYCMTSWAIELACDMQAQRNGYADAIPTLFASVQRWRTRSFRQAWWYLRHEMTTHPPLRVRVAFARRTGRSQAD